MTPTSSTLTLRCAVRSHVGQVRDTNEDAVFVSPRLIAVADGVGGAAAGEVASRTVINAVASLDKTLLEGLLTDALAQSVAAANQTLALLTSRRPELGGMATTLTVVGLHAGEYVVANIGDSRAYLLRDGELTQITRDDSFVQELIDGGLVTAEEARTHPQRSVVMQALDGAEGRAATITTHPAKPGDRVLVCSDGLSDMVGDDVVQGGLAEDDLDACVETLITSALGAGGRDNVSVAVADVVATGSTEADAWG